MAYDRSTSVGTFERLFQEAGALLADRERLVALPDIYQGFLYESKPSSLLRTKADKVPNAKELACIERRARVCDYIMMMLCLDASETEDPRTARVNRKDLVTSLAKLAKIDKRVVGQEVNALIDDHWVNPARRFVASSTEVELVKDDLEIKLNPVRFEFTEEELRAIQPVYPNIEELKLAS